MNTWKVILATMLIFGTGVVTGGLLVHYDLRSGVARPRLGGAAHPAPAASPGGMRLEFLRRMQRDLELTLEQRERVDKILKESQERSRKLMEPVSPLLREEVKRTKEEFRQLLTPEQQAHFDDLLKRQQHSREQHRPGAPIPNVAPLTNTP